VIGWSLAAALEGYGRHAGLLATWRAPRTTRAARLMGSSLRDGEG